MGSVNKVILVGNLGRDAEVRSTPRGAVQSTERGGAAEATQFCFYAREEILGPPYCSSDHRRSLGIRRPDPDADAGVHGAELMFVQHGGHERRVRVTGA